MRYSYNTKGTCSKIINFDINNNIISNVEFIGGCPGNLKAITKLVDKMEISEVINKLEGIRCGNKETSCADQLVCAIKEAISKKKTTK